MRAVYHVGTNCVVFDTKEAMDVRETEVLLTEKETIAFIAELTKALEEKRKLDRALDRWLDSEDEEPEEPFCGCMSVCPDCFTD